MMATAGSQMRRRLQSEFNCVIHTLLLLIDSHSFNRQPRWTTLNKIMYINEAKCHGISHQIDKYKFVTRPSIVSTPPSPLTQYLYLYSPFTLHPITVIRAENPTFGI